MKKLALLVLCLLAACGSESPPSQTENTPTKAAYVGDRVTCARLAEATAGERTPEKNQLLRDSAQAGIDGTDDPQFREVLRSFLNTAFTDDLGAQMTVGASLQAECAKKN
jgi:hypothetical protein